MTSPHSHEEREKCLPAQQPTGYLEDQSGRGLVFPQMFDVQSVKAAGCYYSHKHVSKHGRSKILSVLCTSISDLSSQICL